MEKVVIKRLLFVTLVSIDSITDRNIYADLMRYFVSQGYHVTIISPSERRLKNITKIKEGDSFKILRPKSLNSQKVNKVEKLASMLSIDFLVKSTMKKYLSREQFDLMIYSTPPITLTSSISYAKQKFQCRTYLLLKDIFPQNAVDLNIIKKGSFFYKYFLKVEKKLYQLSDKIGCMSQANVDYILRHNTWINSDRVEIAPNSIEVEESADEKQSDTGLKEKLSIPDEATVFIYGGNLGKPQGIPYLIKILDQFVDRQNAYFIIIGSGTEYQKLKDWHDKVRPQNVILKSSLPKSEYDQYVMLSDVGLIFLDPNFTIPNYPSRLLAYLESRKPVLAFTDKASDIGRNANYRGYGDWAFSGDPEAPVKLINEYIAKSRKELKQMGNIGYQYLVENYQPQNTFKKIVPS